MASENTDNALCNSEKQLNEKENCEKVAFTIPLNGRLNKRFSMHMTALKRLHGYNYSKQRWMQEAVAEKLKSYKNKNLTEELDNQVFHFSLPSFTYNELKELIQNLKKLKMQITKADFFREAIQEKLDRDEQNASELLEHMLRKNLQLSEKENC